jgi:hypothetical protein
MAMIWPRVNKYASPDVSQQHSGLVFKGGNFQEYCKFPHLNMRPLIYLAASESEYQMTRFHIPGGIIKQMSNSISSTVAASSSIS